MEYKGIDLSSYQGKPDWANVSASGIEFAILRITQKTGIDTSFEHNYTGCVSRQIPVGVYRFSYAQNEAEALREAAEVIRVLNGRSLDLPVFYDLEDSSQRKLGAAKVASIAQAFLTKIQEAGYQTGIYCNTDWYSWLKHTSLKTYDFWLASYPSQDNGTIVERLRPSAGIGWQYSSKGKVPGITGPVDLDVFYRITCKPISGIQAVIKKACDELGYLEKKSNSQLDDKKANAGSANYTKYWRDIKPEWQGQPWCAIFLSWVFLKTFGLDTAKKLLKHWPYTYCPTLGSLFPQYDTPKPGDIVLFNRQGAFAHTGLVTKVSGDRFWTVEGNTSGNTGVVANGGGVFEKSYVLSQLKGTKFCRPDYTIVKNTGKETCELELPVLKIGMQNNYVKSIQRLLREKGYKNADGSPLGVDGIFGENTEAAVAKFQKVCKMKIKNTGTVGAKTWKRLLNSY